MRNILLVIKGRFMHKRFDHVEIEKRWQEKWRTTGLYDLGVRDHTKEKEYVLVEWPYPSGNLHIGHWHAFAVPDIYVRYRRMNGVQVLFPMGFDAFGLPAENAAIKRQLNPKEWTEGNMTFMEQQLRSMGNAFSWDKTTASTDPEYYKWTQWMFGEFFKNNIAYRGEGVVNWCPDCHTVIANEQVQSDNTCMRCSSSIEKKMMPQWMIRITDFADELVDDIEPLNWPEHIKEAQKNWIGRSEGAEIDFPLSVGESVTVFTTRPDTLYGATYLVLAPEHALVQQYKNHILNWDEVETYVKLSQQKAEQDRLDATKEKTGVKLEGITATNPGSGETIPVYIADYVIATYGTGAIMAVPAHDERDYAFAQKYELPITQVIVPCAEDTRNPPQREFDEVKRDTIIVHLRDASNGKFALLNWHGSLEGITTAIMGGIEEGQTPEEAAYTEILEEAGLQNVRICKKLRWITAAKYCASHKKQNRCAHAYTFLAEVPNLQGQVAISDVEQKIHSLVWVSEEDVYAKLTPDHQKFVWELLHSDENAIVGNGYLVNSGEFSGVDTEEAKVAITKKVGGRMTNTYRLRDWSVGRQRYWGTPIPIVYDPQGEAHAVPLEHLPWTLPEDVDFTPTGVAPLAKSQELKERTEKIFGAGWTPEVETMDTFVDSSWYYLRYIDNRNSNEFSSLKAQKTWLPVDLYFGGSEHNTMHLLYSRFWLKALRRLGLAECSEPYVRRINRGLILGPDGNKMSKSKGNVVDPDEQVARVGADTVKMYLAFMGPYAEMANYPWDMGGIAGLRRFLERVHGLSDHVTNEGEIGTALLHKTIKKVTEDIKLFKFNTAISAMMIYLNQVERTGLTKESYLLFLRLLAPFAPHLTEELWTVAGNVTSIHTCDFPTYDPALTEDERVTIGVQINGKLRGQISIRNDATEAEAVAAVDSDKQLQVKLSLSKVEKVIYVPGRILNIVITE